MENGSVLGTWIAYVAIVIFLILVLALVVRTMSLFATLTFMPVARVMRQITRLFGRRDNDAA